MRLQKVVLITLKVNARQIPTGSNSNLKCSVKCGLQRNELFALPEYECGPFLNKATNIVTSPSEQNNKTTHRSVIRSRNPPPPPTAFFVYLSM